MNKKSLLVIGENPDKLLEKYNKNLIVEPHVFLYFRDAHIIKENKIKTLEELVNNQQDINLSNENIDYFKQQIEDLKNLNDTDFFYEITKGCQYDKDNNAITTANTNGKWVECKKGGDYVYPLQLLNGDLTNEAYNHQIDWSNLHLINMDLYNRAWDICHNICNVENDDDIKIQKNARVLQEQMKNFASKLDYVLFCTSYWTYAILNEDGWFDLDGAKNAHEWVVSFYDRFIASLSFNERLTIYEYS